MTDQKPAGVFVRLPLSNEQIGKLLAPIRTLDGRLLSIGTPVQTRELTVVTTLGTLRDPIPCVRQSEAQTQIAALEAEVVRLRETITVIDSLIMGNSDPVAMFCGIHASCTEALKGGAA